MRCIRKYNRITVGLIALILLAFLFGGANMAYESLQNTNHTEEKSYNSPGCNIFCDLEIENFITVLKILLFYDYLK